MAAPTHPRLPRSLGGVHPDRTLEDCSVCGTVTSPSLSVSATHTFAHTHTGFLSFIDCRRGRPVLAFHHRLQT